MKLLYKTLRAFIYFFAFVGVILCILLGIIFFRPEILEMIGLHEVSSELYACMTYQDSALIEQIKNWELTLQEAQEIADTRNDIDVAYTECLKDIFGYHTIWVNENNFIIYD